MTVWIGRIFPLPSIVEYLLQKGRVFVPISEIILKGEYTIDHTGRQCPAE